MTQAEFKDRTKAFALAIVRLVEELPRGLSVDVIGRQLIRAATSVGANYRSVCRARSRREFIARLGVVEEEADEAQFWLELVSERGWVASERISWLRDEAGEIVAIAVSSIRTARRTPRSNLQSPIRNPQFSNPQCS